MPPDGSLARDATGLTPAQQRTLEALRRTDGDPVVFDRDLVTELRADAADALG